MIPLNELRKGIVVHSKTHNVLNAVVEGFTPTGLVLLKGITTYDKSDLLEPIKITPEILEKCGFVEKPHKIIKSTWLLNDVLLLQYEPEVLFIQNGRSVIVRYVHQLQNLYFALTEKELEIKL